MVPKNKYVKNDKLIQWTQWCRSLCDLYKTSKHFQRGSIVEPVNYLRMYRWISAQDHLGKSKILNQLLLDSMISADAKAKGSGVYVPFFIFDDVFEVLGRASSLEYFKIINDLQVSSFAKEVFEALYNLSGPMTKIILKQSSGHDVVIKTRDSFSFPMKIDPQFHRMIGHVELIEQTNPSVLMIEGAPETIGEIHSLLERNHENGRPILLVARNFPEEISATLATNWLKGSLSVLPMTYGANLNTINLAADLCAVTRGELISPHFGDVISVALLDEDKWGSVDRLEWTSRGVNLYSSSKVDRHVNSILQKLEATSEEDLQELLRDRILSLSNDALELWIPKDDKILMEELDQMIKHYNGFIAGGIAKTSIGEIPEVFARAASETAKSLREEILNIGGFLVRVNNAVVA